LTNNAKSSRKRLWIVLASVALITIALFGYIFASSTFSVAPPAVQPSNSNVPLGPMGRMSSMSNNMGGMYCGSSGYYIIDPPAGQPLQEPVMMQDSNPDPNIFECNVTAQMANIDINGVTANLHTYNGYYPAPTIQIKQGDILKVHFKNSLPTVGANNLLGFPQDTVNIHTHGLHVSPQEPSDHPDVMLLPGQTYNYEYNTSLVPAGGFAWYHSHVHGRTAEEFDMAGSLIVQDDSDLFANVETHILFIKDITIVNGERAPYLSVMEYVVGKEGNMVLVNGQLNPALNIKPGQVQRWRIINACNARFLRVSLQGHALSVIGADAGGLLDQPYTMPEVLMSPAERVDVLVKANQTAGSYKLLALPYNSGCGNTAELVTLMTVNYAGAPANDVLPAVVDAKAMRANVDLTTLPVKRFVLAMTMGRGLINGHDFDVDPLNITSTVNTYEIWEISVQCMMDHCFHMHINQFQVLSVFGGDSAYGAFYTQVPAWKDTVYIPAGGTVRILVKVADFTGMTMFHCHIVDHEDIGMMGNWNIVSADSSSPMM
jgi:FtsP/CotA-like multicopper oxidase with cupredoxin domain